MPTESKKTLRHTHQCRRNMAPASLKQTASERIAAKILASPHYQTAQNIALYYPINGEVDLDYVWQCASAQGIHCYFPVLNNDHTLSFLPATHDTPFYRHRLGIWQPNVSMLDAKTPDQLDILYIPLLAFDATGTRLGMGGGYYDRTLALHHSPLLMGVAYEFQREIQLPSDPWDIPLAGVITELNTYWSTQ